MRVVEKLFEFRTTECWDVRVWTEEWVIPAGIYHVRQKGFSPLDRAGCIAAVPGVSAVQIKFSPVESILVYPKWP
jgi:hypothetical protein